MSKKFKSSVFFLLIILLFISTLFGFFHNSYNLIKQDYATRMLSIYGDCSKDGYGFTKYINDKYLLALSKKNYHGEFNDKVLFLSDYISHINKFNLICIL